MISNQLKFSQAKVKQIAVISTQPILILETIGKHLNPSAMKFLRLGFLFLLTIQYSCVNEFLDMPDPSTAIAVNSELYNLLQKVADNDFENDMTCIEFNYPFTLIIYDENMNIFKYQSIRSDIEFREVLGSLEDGKSISLSYPISSVLDNGQSYEITNNQELEEALGQCLKADTIITCNNILTQTSCIWKVSHLDGPNPQYENSYFQVSSLGNAGLYFQNHSFGGTWITYFIEDKLHLNIFIVGDEEVSTDWNYDWKVVDFNDSQMEIENGTDHFLLVKYCFEPCIKFLIEECETEFNSGVAIFDLESYFGCFFPFTDISDPSTVTWSYYESEEDMIAGINPIEDLLYSNVTNPQVIYVRFDDITTGEMVTFIPLILKAINC